MVVQLRFPPPPPRASCSFQQTKGRVQISGPSISRGVSFDIPVYTYVLLVADPGGRMVRSFIPPPLAAQESCDVLFDYWDIIIQIQRVK